MVFLPCKNAEQIAQFNFLISEAQRNSAIAEQHFRAKFKRSLTSAIEILQHNANNAVLRF